MFTIKKITIYAIVAISIAGFSFFISNDSNYNTDINTIKKNKLSIPEEERKWSNSIKEEGAKEAYSIFKNTYERLDINNQHTLAHVFGGVLYQEEGLYGVTVCDQSFSFGCYHEFLGRAISDNGTPVIAELNEKCTEHLRDQALGCQHGIGHGILTFSGYNYEALESSLILCDTLPVYDPIGGCKGGVFMEYNMQTVLGDAGELRQFIDDKGPHFPCDVLDDKYKETCYFWQPQWWQSALAEPSGAKMLIDGFRELGELCHEINDTSVRVQCYRGIGNNAPGSIGWEIETMQYMCSLMPTNEGEVECLTAGAGAFFANERYKDIASELCKMEDEEGKQHCLTISQLPH